MNKKGTLRFGAILIVLAMMSILLATGVLGTEPGVPTITVGMVEAKAGEKISVPVTISGNPGVCGMILSVEYAEDLILCSVDNDTLLGEPLHGGDLSANPYILSWDASATGMDNRKDGTLMVLNFLVKEQANAENCSVSVHYDSQNITNYELEDVYFEIQNGGVKILRDSSFWLVLLGVIAGLTLILAVGVVLWAKKTNDTPVNVISKAAKVFKKNVLRVFCLLIAVVLLGTTLAQPVAAATYTPEEFTVEEGRKVSITNRGVNALQGTNIIFDGDGPHGFVARVSRYNLSGELVEQNLICKNRTSWSDVLFYGGTYVVEVLLGTLEVTYNYHEPEIEIVTTNETISWIAETTFENIYLTVGDTAEYGIHDVYPGFSVWLADYFYSYDDKRKIPFESSKYRVASISADGLITAKSPGVTTVTVAFRFGTSEENSILFVIDSKVNVLDNYGIEDAYSNYYASDEKYFHITGMGQTQPISGVEVMYGKNTYDTGDRNDLLLKVDAENERDIIFTKNGYHSYWMPAKYISDYNFVTLCPDDGMGMPVIKAVYGCDLSNNQWQNLQVQALHVRGGGNYCIDVDIDWQNKEPLSVWLQQGEEKITFGTPESTGFIHLGDKLSTNAGPVYLYAMAVDGTTVKTQVLLNVYKPVEVFELDFGDEKGLNAEPEGIDGFNDIGFSMKLGGSVPIEYSVDKDGKIKGTLGLNMLQKEATTSAYNIINDGLSKSPSSTGGGVDVTEMLDQLCSSTDVEPQWVKKSFAITCDLVFLGCFEGYLKNGKPVITDFKVAMCVKGEAKYSRQSIAFYVPYYWIISLEVAVESQLISVREETSGALSLRIPETELGITGTGALALGIQGLAGVGAELSASLKIRFKAGENIDQGIWTVCVAFMPRLDVLGFEFKAEVWKPHEEVIYDGSNKSVYQEQNYILAGRSYYEATPVLERTLENGDPSLKMQLLFEDIYPDARPQIAAVGEQMVMVWVGDNAERTDENRTCLYFCVYDRQQQTWTQPQAIWDDGRAEYTPKLYVIDGVAHLVWLKASCLFEPGVTLRETAAKLDVHYAAFDALSGIFSEPVNLSASEGTYDFSPYVTQVKNRITVVWGSNPNGDLFSGESCYSVHAAQLEEGTWTTNTLATQTVPINGLTACEKDGALLVCFSGHTDGQLGTLNDLELFTVSQGVLSQVTTNDVADTAPEYFGDCLFFCGSDGLTDGETVVPFPTTKSSYMIVEDSEHSLLAVLYTVLTEESHNVYATIYNGQSWGEPIRVTDLQGQYIADFSACFAGDELVSVMNLRQICEDGTLGTASLVQSRKSVFADLAILDADYESVSLVAGGVLRGTVTVQNAGMQQVDAAMIEIYDDEDRLISAVQIKDLPLLPGQTRRVPFVCKVDDIPAASIRLTVSGSSITESNEENNHYSLTIRKSDISVENAYITEDVDGMSTVMVFLANRGMVDLYDIRLSFCKDASDGEQLGTMLVSMLKVGEKKILSLQIPTSSIEDVVYITANIQQPENTYANNANFAYINSIHVSTQTSVAYCPGDINGDGLLSEEDIYTLRRYLVGGYDTIMDETVGDVNQDGAINAKDVVALRKMLPER